ncbi:glycoside hydrolase family 9 protein [Umezawaea beigongshangensis]|uniref:glycoside hydrolase family 9 protein n=1 Tax=Umezawaea beigongshangensis TaxID=2780383 RepID=UPI0018F193AA|nr:glycoside hydrolase family 9 protein [Umezawaea beigongshangensis]
MLITALVLPFAGLTGGGAATASDTADAAEQVLNGNFDAGTAPWWWTANSPAAVVDGRLCAEVAGGTSNAWDAIIGQNAITLVDGESYEFSFTASASAPRTVLANVQLADPPYTAQVSTPTTLGAEPRTFTTTFTSTAETSAGQVAFQIGGGAEPWTFCVDDVSLRGGAEPPAYEPDTGPRVRVSQVGYLPTGPKRATVVTGATAPLGWELKDASGAVVETGTASPHGLDPSSRQSTQLIDFSGFTAHGSGYTLTADGETSHPFDITPGLYDALRSDSLAFFYHQRSGTPIEASLVGTDYARPAGHLQVAPNQGDVDVPCQPGVCDYRLDVRGGWYDAGDQGKYVVNGGIATAQLLGQFERTKTAPVSYPDALGDGTLRVPERNNGVPDVLDEARWELEFLSRMQVPAGQPLAGMVHHKIHDAQWTGLPQRPELDAQPRELHPPSTAATLNLAAVAAQGARLFAPYDGVFSDRLLETARTAYAAALAHPDVYASPADSTGGGAYDDTNVSDEFYWAAAELYLTTGENAFLNAVTSSPHHTGDVFGDAGFSWNSLAAIARLDLATVPSSLPDREAVRASVRSAANRYVAIAEADAWDLPFAPAGGETFWGSNSNVLNNGVVLAVAYDISGDTRYRDAALATVDYVLGRNPLNKSYVAGYGEAPVRNLHHRFWANQNDPSLPIAPPGSLAGGPNSGLQDPIAAAKLAGCAPAMCFIDDIGSYSTNEVAINWNSALAWMASFAADQGGGEPVSGRCSVSYQQVGSWKDGFVVRVAVTNTGVRAVTGWRLSFAFAGAQRLLDSWDATSVQSGATVTVTPAPRARTIRPGATSEFWFRAETSGAAPAPTLFRLNGNPCTS